MIRLLNHISGHLIDTYFDRSTLEHELLIENRRDRTGIKLITIRMTKCIEIGINASRNIEILSALTHRLYRLFFRLILSRQKRKHELAHCAQVRCQ